MNDLFISLFSIQGYFPQMLFAIDMGHKNVTILQNVIFIFAVIYNIGISKFVSINLSI